MKAFIYFIRKEYKVTNIYTEALRIRRAAKRRLNELNEMSDKQIEERVKEAMELATVLVICNELFDDIEKYIEDLKEYSITI